MSRTTLCANLSQAKNPAPVFTSAAFRLASRSRRKLMFARTVLLLLTMNLADATLVAAQGQNDSQIGYSTLNGGTNGGEGGAEVTVSNLNELRTSLRSTSPLIIKVRGTITLTSNINCQGNKTIIGLPGAIINGAALYFQNKRNVIIRNIKFSGGTIAGSDYLTIRDSSTNFWIDHCEFDKPNGDGTIDITNASDFITLSWCRFTERGKSILIGNTIESPDKFHVTFHHCYFLNLSERAPSVRYGRVHIFNCYYNKTNSESTSYQVASREDAHVRIEHSYFRNINQRPLDDLRTNGKFAGVATNIFENCAPNRVSNSDESYVPPYSYGGYLDPVFDVPEIVAEYAGATLGSLSDLQAPVVTAASPGNNATEVNTTVVVSATFDEVLDPTTINGTTFELRNSSNSLIPATVAYNPTTRTAILTPSINLASETLYIVTLRGGAVDPRIKDISKNALAANFSWQFTTATPIDVTPPTVSATNPLNNATGLSTDANITAVFNEALDPTTLNGTTFELRNPANALIAAAVTYNATTRTATLDPTTNLARGTQYTATLRGGTVDPRVTDLAGNALAANFSWQFTTATPADVTPPTVSATNPLNNATGVSTDANITAVFNEALDPATLNSTTFELRNPSNALIAAAVTYNATTRTATLNPTTNLASGTQYRATLRGGTVDPRIRDIAGNALAANFSWQFTTAPASQQGPFTIWSPSTVPSRLADPDAVPIEVGVKFRALVNGTIAGIRFYKSQTNTGTHIGNLWSRNGTNLARATFTNETASGWQQVLFGTPVAVTAGTTYIASYFTPSGHYSVNENYFRSTVQTPYLQALATGVDGGNGVYRYASGTGFPTSTYNASNYWVDVLFVPSNSTQQSQAPLKLGERPHAVDVQTLSEAIRANPAVNLSAYPNPFSLFLTAQFEIPETNEVHLDLYSLAGRRVRQLFQGSATGQQRYSFHVDCSDLSPGMYVLKLIMPNHSETFSIVRID